jgi:hypothetical protein
MQTSHQTVFSSILYAESPSRILYPQFLQIYNASESDTKFGQEEGQKNLLQISHILFATFFSASSGIGFFLSHLDPLIDISRSDKQRE